MIFEQNSIAHSSSFSSHRINEIHEINEMKYMRNAKRKKFIYLLMYLIFQSHPRIFKFKNEVAPVYVRNQCHKKLKKRLNHSYSDANSDNQCISNKSENLKTKNSEINRYQVFRLRKMKVNSHLNDFTKKSSRLITKSQREVNNQALSQSLIEGCSKDLIRKNQNIEKIEKIENDEKLEKIEKLKKLKNRRNRKNIKFEKIEKIGK